jgi:hypothetical protein
MDIETETLLNIIVERAVTKAVAEYLELYQNDRKLFLESLDKWC